MQPSPDSRGGCNVGSLGDGKGDRLGSGSRFPTNRCRSWSLGACRGTTRSGRTCNDGLELENHVIRCIQHNGLVCVRLADLTDIERRNAKMLNARTPFENRYDDDDDRGETWENMAELDYTVPAPRGTRAAQATDATVDTPLCPDCGSSSVVVSHDDGRCPSVRSERSALSDLRVACRTRTQTECDGRCGIGS